MKTLHQLIVSISLLLLFSLQIISAQDTTKLNLPEGVKLRIGKGTLGEIAYFPDGTRFAVATSIGIQVYDSITGKELYQLTDHANGVYSIRFSPDGNIIATESADGCILLWNTNSGEHIHTLSDDDFGLYDPVFSPNGKIIAVQCAERFTYFQITLRLYDVKTGKHINTISEPTNLSYNVRFSPDNKTLLTWQYGKIKLWDVATAHHLKTINNPAASQHDGNIEDVQFSPNGRILFVLCSRYPSVRTVYFRNINSEKWNQLKRSTQNSNDKGYSSMFFSPDVNTLATIHKSDGRVDLWDVSTGEYIRSLIGNDSSKISTLSFSSNGRFIATSGHDGTIHLWAAKHGMPLIPLSGHKGSIHNIVFSPDGMTLLSKGTDNTVHLWNAITGQLLTTLDGYAKRVYDVEITPDGNTIASWSSDETLRLYDYNTGKLHKQHKLNEQHKLNGIEGDVRTFYFSPNGNTFITQSDWSGVYLWDLDTGKLINKLSERKNYIDYVHISPNGKTIAAGGDDDIILIWDANTGQLLNTITDIKGKLYQVHYSTDGSIIVSKSEFNTQLWDPNTGQLIRTITGISGWIDGVYFSKNANSIVTSIYFESDDDGSFLWDGMTGQHIRDLNYSGSTSFVSSSPDGKIMAIVDGHGSGVSLFNINKRQHLGELAGHVSLESCGGGTISDVRFSHNGKTVATASSVDATAIIWNPNTGERLKTLSGHTGGISSIAFSPDGKTLASGSRDGTILLWEVP